MFRKGLALWVMSVGILFILVVCPILGASITGTVEPCFRPVFDGSEQGCIGVLTLGSVPNCVDCLASKTGSLLLYWDDEYTYFEYMNPFFASSITNNPDYENFYQLYLTRD